MLADGAGFSWDKVKDLLPRDLLTRLPNSETYVELRDELDRLLALRAASEDRDAGTAAELCLDIADVSERLGDFSAAEHAVGVARDTADATAPRRVRIDANLRTARILARGGDLDASWSLLLDLAADCDEAGELEALCLALVSMSTIDLARGSTDAALDELNRAFEIGRRMDFTAGKGYALTNAGAAYVVNGDFGRARDLLSRAALLSQREGDAEVLGKTYLNIGVSYFQDRGRFVEAIPFLELGLELVARRADLLTTVNALSTTFSAWCHQDPDSPHDVRQQIAPLLGALPVEDFGRLRDRTVIPLGTPEIAPDATYAREPTLSQPIIFLVMPTFYVQRIAHPLAAAS
jgi:tetratricopeptide (TPR) repeat protein